MFGVSTLPYTRATRRFICKMAKLIDEDADDAAFAAVLRDEHTRELGRLITVEDSPESPVSRAKPTGRGKRARVEAEEPEDEDEESTSSEDEPRPWAGKGKGKFARISPQAPAAASPKRGRAKKPGNRPRPTAQDRSERLGRQIRHSMVCFAKESSRRALSRDEYEKTQNALRVNLEMLRADTATTDPGVARLLAHEWKPRDVTVRLPIESVRDNPTLTSADDMLCKGCSTVIEDEFVRTQVCMRAKFHWPCASLVLEAVGARLFFECMAHMCHHRKCAGTIAFVNAEKEPVSCRHTPAPAALKREIETNLALLCKHLPA